MAFVIYIGLLLAIAGFGAAGAWLRMRRQRVRAVVQTLASIVSQNLPLAEGMRAAAAGERRGLQRIYDSIATRLAVGDRLSTALRVSLPACSGEIVGTLQAGEAGGTLPSVLQSLARDAQQESFGPEVPRLPLWYPLLLGTIILSLVVLVYILVLPKFSAIFRDYEVPMPALTRALFDMGRGGRATAVTVYGVMLGAVLIVAQVTLARQFVVRVPGRLQLSYALWDTAVWYLPWARQAARTRALSLQLPILQAAVRVGHDLAQAARQATLVAVNVHACRWVRRWAQALEAGADPLEAARKLHGPKPLLLALAAAREGGDLAAYLEYLADYYQRLRLHWERLIVATVTPLLVIAWAVCVACIAMAMLLPLVALEQSVMNSIY